MSAPAIHPDAILAALPDFDADVVCELRHDCEHPAVWRVVAHGIRKADTECSVRTYLVCDACLNSMRTIAQLYLLNGPGVCKSCKKTFRHVSEVIRSVVAL